MGLLMASGLGLFFNGRISEEHCVHGKRACQNLYFLPCGDLQRALIQLQIRHAHLSNNPNWSSISRHDKIPAPGPKMGIDSLVMEFLLPQPTIKAGCCYLGAESHLIFQHSAEFVSNSRKCCMGSAERRR